MSQQNEGTVASEQDTGMRPIWYFVGWMLVMIGSLVVIAGIYGLFYTLPSKTIFPNMHIDLWWGAILILAGILYIWKNKDVFIE